MCGDLNVVVIARSINMALLLFVRVLFKFANSTKFEFIFPKIRWIFWGLSPHVRYMSVTSAFVAFS